MTKRKMSIAELVQQLQSEQLIKKDMIVPAKCLAMVEREMEIRNAMGSVALKELLDASGISNDGTRISLTVADICHDQIAEKLEIPKQYYQRMNTDENKFILDYSVNHWMDKKGGNYFVRTFIDEVAGTGILRAMLSDRFKVIDNFDVLMAALQAIKESGIEVNVCSADLTDKKMYVRFEAPSVVAESTALLSRYRVPDIGSKDNGIVAGFVITNSETGHGGFSIFPRLRVRACDNGMIVSKDAMRKVHIGSRMEEFSEIKWSSETHEKNLELIVAQTKDSVKTFLSQEYLGRAIARIEEKGAVPLEHPIDAVVNVCKELSMSEDRQKSILDYFVKSGDSTPFGITQAITYYAHKNADADDQFDLERVALSVVDNAASYDKQVVVKAKMTKGFSAN